MKARPILFLIVTVSSLLTGLWLRTQLRPKPLADIALSQDGAEIPMEVYGGHLFVQATVNGKTGQFLLDSGAADMFISEAKALSLGLVHPSQISPPGSASENASENALENKLQGTRTQATGTQTTRVQNKPTIYVPNVSFQIGALTLTDHRSVVMSKAEVTGLSQYFGRTLDGILGHEFFQQLVVEMDYAQGRLRLHHPKTYRYQGSGQPMLLQVNDRRAYLKAEIAPYGHQPLSATLLLDSGSNGALSIKAGCGVDRQLIAAAPQILQRQLTTFYGIQPIQMGRVQSLTLGTTQLKTPLTTFESDPRGACDRVTGKIGAQILRQFRVIVNYPQQQLILEPLSAPLSRPSDDYSYDLSGLWLQAEGAAFQTYRVANVFPQTPAAKVGLKKGDIVRQINGKSTQQMPLSQIRQLLSQPNPNLQLQIQRSSNVMEFRLGLAPLI